jgi:hypothetical protein
MLSPSLDLKKAGRKKQDDRERVFSPTENSQKERIGENVEKQIAARIKNGLRGRISPRFLSKPGVLGAGPTGLPNFFPLPEQRAGALSLPLSPSLQIHVEIPSCEPGPTICPRF